MFLLIFRIPTISTYQSSYSLTIIRAIDLHIRQLLHVTLHSGFPSNVDYHFYSLVMHTVSIFSSPSSSFASQRPIPWSSFQKLYLSLQSHPLQSWLVSISIRRLQILYLSTQFSLDLYCFQFISQKWWNFLDFIASSLVVFFSSTCQFAVQPRNVGLVGIACIVAIRVYAH